jgi:hypothetical protein
MPLWAQKQIVPQQSPFQISGLGANTSVLTHQLPVVTHRQTTNELGPSLYRTAASPGGYDFRAGNLGRNPSRDFCRIAVHAPSSPILQTKLTVNSSGDIYEQEADRAVAQVMRTTEPGLAAAVPTLPGSFHGVQRACSCGGSCSDCKRKKPGTASAQVRMKSFGASGVGQSEAPPIVHEVLRSPGQPLDASTRAFMEPRFGYDFGRVRVHKDSPAAESARAISAEAYTVGSDVVFAAGRFAPFDLSGQRLIAHELAHIVQQDPRHSSPGAEKVLQRAPKKDSDTSSKTAPKNVCGPDVTHWFVDTVSDAKKNKAVLKIQQNFADANAIMKYLGLPDIRLLAEYFVDEKVTAAWKSAGEPPVKGEAKGQRMSAASGFFAMKQAEQKVLSFDAYELALLVRAKNLTRDAADMWIGLVQDGSPYDFKNSARALGNPHSANCPKDCKGTLTLCDMCFKTYVPGDLFYAHVGRFVGWSDLALRLGSQYAQLLSKKKDWDPPEDSAMLTIGLGLPDPLTAKALCGALQGGGGQLTEQCAICSEPLVP